MATLSKLDKLTYSIGIIDKVTGPVNKVMAKINQLSQQTAAAQDQMMRGATTAVGGGYALAKSLAPAIDHVAALGEVQSLGVTDDALQQLTKTAYKFGFQFGGNSAEFVRSAYDIQSAIAGLNGFELSEFTKTSNILAVATKADAATITSYMGTMYGIFEKTANKMGKANWVNQIAGQTATAVQLYKTTGAEMQAAFSNLGATATNIGLSSAQQFALVGELQLVAKSGSVAGTQAASLLQGIGKAQDALGIKLTADNGDMLAIDVVLGRINNRLSSLGSVARGDVLTQIFGKQGAKAVDVLSTKVDKLKDGISVFENVQDNSKALEMANIIASPWDRLGGSFNAAATAMGNRLLPVVEPFVEILAAGFAGIVSLTERFPFLSSAIATVIVGVVALITAFGIATFAMGLYNFATKIGITLANAQIIVNKLWLASLWALRVSGFVALIASMGAAAIAMGTFKAVMLAGQAATWLFNAALWANPITWIVAGVLALIAAVAALIYYFDDITAAFSEWADSSLIFQGLRVAFDLLTLPLQLMWWLIKTIATGIYNALAPAFSAIGAVFSFLWDVVSGIGGAIAGFFGGIAQGIGGFFSSIWSGAGELISQFVNFLGEKFSFVTNFFSGIGNFIGGIFDRITGFLKNIADNGILNMVVSFFSDEETVAVKAKVDQTALEPKVAQQKTMVMQSADQAYSRDYGQAVISKATQVPGNTASTNYAAADDAVYSVNKTAAINSVAQLQGNNAVNKINSEITKNDVLNNNAASSATANVHTNAVTTAANDAVYSTSTAMNSEINPTLQNSALNNSAVNKMNYTLAPTNPANNNYASANDSINKTVSTTDKFNYVGQSAQSTQFAPQSALQNNVASTANNFTNAANLPVFSSSQAPLSSVNQTVSPLQPLVVEKAQTSAVTMAANDAAYSTTGNINNSATNSVLQSSPATHNDVGHNAQSTQFVTQSAIENGNTRTANHFTNAANSPVYSQKYEQLARFNQSAAPLQRLPMVKTDQAITNTANAYSVEQLNTEQQHTNSYKAKVQKSAFLQSLTSSTSQSSSSESDNSKRVHIDNLTIKSDDLAQSFEQMMELAS
ncbi:MULTISPECIES: phage tail tape measure protein [Pseudoalteromonas]|uniref:phage tail tape measure protein n=1 Tax=Pseudoalteromonas TaxID=53246 RepID=UPI000579F770|nr:MULTISPECIES: phage tail tape measure protein [Pseudoalteromonas]ATG57927.1 phage tail tape measure protein [Pseudoalteromonas marina]